MTFYFLKLQKSSRAREEGGSSNLETHEEHSERKESLLDELSVAGSKKKDSKEISSKDSKEGSKDSQSSSSEEKKKDKSSSEEKKKDKSSSEGTGPDDGPTLVKSKVSNSGQRKAKGEDDVKGGDEDGVKTKVSNSGQRPASTLSEKDQAKDAKEKNPREMNTSGKPSGGIHLLLIFVANCWNWI